MANFLRLSCMTATLVAVALTAAALEPEWAHDLRMEHWTVSALLAKWQWQQKVMAESRHPDEAQVGRLKAKHRIAVDLIRGKVTLGQAAAAFRALNRKAAVNFGDDDVCPQLMAWVRIEMEHMGRADIDQFVAALEAEVSRQKQKGGTVIWSQEASQDYQATEGAPGEQNR